MILATFNTRTANSFTGVVAFPLQQGVGGGVQTRSFTGTLSPAGVIVRQPTHIRAGVLISSGILGPLALSRLVISALPMTGNLTTQRQQARTFTGTLALAGALGQVSVQRLLGTLGFVGTLIRQASIARAGVLVPTGGLHTSPQVHSYAGTLGLAGTLTTIRSHLLTATGTLAMTGALSRVVSITRTGIIASAGALRQTASHLFAAGLTSAGRLVIGVTQRLTGVLPSTGTAELTQGQAIAFLGTLISTGDLRLGPALDLPGSLGLDGLLTGQPTIAVQGRLDFDGGVFLGMDLQVTGLLGLDGALELAGDRIIDATGTLPMAGTAIQARVLELSGQLATIHTLSFVVIPFKVIHHILQLSGELTTSFAKSMAGVVSMASAVRWRVTRTFSGTVHPLGAAYQQARLAMAGSAGLAGEVAFVGVEILALSGIVAPVGILAAPLMERLLAGVIGSVGAVVFTPALLIRHGTITMVNAILRFAGLTAPKLTEHGTVQDPALRDHTTLDDPELR